MSEYWVSHKKYFCKYCEIYIADDAPSRQQHENGLRHKGNVERFVRGIYKAGEKRVKDLEEEKREMARVERAAQAAFASDVGAGHAKGSSSSSVASTSKPRAPPPKPSNDPYANYSTAQSLGYTDPDAERLKAEAERRRMQGVAGDWEVVYTSSASASAPPTTEETMTGVKRGLDLDEEDRAWKLRKKTLNAGLGEVYDPGLIPIKLKVKKEETKVEEAADSATGNVKESGDATRKQKWTKVQWQDAEGTGAQETSSSITVKVEQSGAGTITADPESSTKESQGSPVKPEDEDATLPPPAQTANTLFRKRKTPASVPGRGKRS